MVPQSVMIRIASALTAAGIVLALANWYMKPEAALAWTAVLVMFAVRMAVLYLLAGQETDSEQLSGQGQRAGLGQR